MKSTGGGKELYRQLRALPWSRLWTDEVAQFNRASTRERFDRVAVIRAVGAVFPESGPPGQREEVLTWLRTLLDDPEEKVRRYAMAALPKIGASPADEAKLLEILHAAAGEREAKFVGNTLNKIGGAATLEALETSPGTAALPSQTEQKVRASVARQQSPSVIVLDRALSGFEGLRIHLRGREGLESFVRQEVEDQGMFRVAAVRPGLVILSAPPRFALADLFRLRCFGTAGFVLGSATAGKKDPAGQVEAIASLIASPRSQRLLRALTDGPIRYRLEFVAKGHQRGAVREVVNRAFALCPEILNDARQAPWAIDVHPAGQEDSVELRPRFSPDPRQTYRLGDVPAASHPPLAASMARLAGLEENESIWDPFCGSGLELVERVLRGGVQRVFGTDRSPEAIEIAQKNFAAAPLPSVDARFLCCDFREFARTENLTPGSLTLIITNPPLGRRVPIHNLRGLFHDLFCASASLLAPGGRLILTNPFLLENPHPALKRDFRQVVDMGGFTCRLERYRKRVR